MPLKVSSLPMGSWMGTALAFRRSLDHVQHVIEIRAHDVHLVDVNHAGDMILVGLMPNGLRLRLNATLGAQNGNSSRPARAGSAPPPR